MLINEKNTLEFLNEFFGCDYQRNPLASTNIEEIEDGYIFNIMVPGFHKDDIKINIKDDVLIVKGKVEDMEDKRFIRKEFSNKSFVRSFQISNDLDEDNINATCKNGLLIINLSKKKEKDKFINID